LSWWTSTACSSSDLPGGLSALFEANELATEQDRALRLVCHSRIVNRALEATELCECFTFADTVSDALK
jgi:hypothetical protein